MEMGEFEALTRKIEHMVDQYIDAKKKNDDLISRNRELEKQVSSLEKHLHKSEKEVDRIGKIVARNKAYEKNYGLLKSKVASVLAKVDSLQ